MSAPTPLSAVATPVALRRPPLLRPGDRVCIVAPGGPFDRERFDAGLAWLRSVGLEPVHDEDLFARDAYLAGCDEHRAAILAAALADRSIRALWAARGGYGATRLLPRVDRQAIAARGPWLIGFSDVTALHAQWQRAGLVSVHGANVTSLPQWSEPGREALRALLFEGRMATLGGTPAARGEPAHGWLAGGNLAVLAALAGTGFLPDLAGAIVFLEDVRERPYRLDRTLTQLVQCGAFEAVAGFAIGHLTDCDAPAGDPYGRTALQAVHDVLEPLGQPIVTGFPVGHGPDSMPLPLGYRATLDPAAGTLAFDDA